MNSTNMSHPILPEVPISQKVEINYDTIFLAILGFGIFVVACCVSCYNIIFIDKACCCDLLCCEEICLNKRHENV